ncbi:MAG: hypothetical protein PF448_10490 [Bacteroidales bacterium]|nr:hypothetical protein [Bacteroidales bacterium]
MCLRESDFHEPVKNKKSKSRGLKYWLGFAAAFALFYAIGHFGGEEIVMFFKSEKTSKEVLEQKWIKKTYGNYGLTVETPSKMTKGNLPIPDNVKQVIDQMDVYNYKSEKGFKVLINSIKYNPSIGQTNLQGAANGSIKEMKMQKGVTEFDYTEDYISKNKIPGFIQKGKYNLNDIEIKFINTGFSKGLIIWQVMVAYQANDEIGQVAANRVIDSIELNAEKANAL